MSGNRKTYDVSDDQLMGTRCQRPFISHDGGGTEVRVRKGIGVISEFSVSGGALQVSFEVALHADDKGITRMKYQPAGWVPSGADDVRDFLKKAAQSGEPIQFRIESSRKKDIDDDVPFEQIQAKDTRALLVAVAPVDAGEFTTANPHWLHTDEILTDPADDPDENRSAFGRKKAAQPADPTAPWALRLDDGSINPGSNVVGAAISAYAFISDYGRQNKIESLWAADGSDKKAVARAEAYRRRVSEILLDVCDAAQVAVTPGMEGPDRGLASHTRARGIVFEMVRTWCHIKEETLSSKETMDAWKRRLTESSIKTWQWAIETADKSAR